MSIGDLVLPTNHSSAVSAGVGANSSLREMAQQIENDRDMEAFITSHARNVPAKPAEIRYEKHAVR